MILTIGDYDVSCYVDRGYSVSCTRRCINDVETVGGTVYPISAGAYFLLAIPLKRIPDKLMQQITALAHGATSVSFLFGGEVVTRKAIINVCSSTLEVYSEDENIWSMSLEVETVD